MKLRLFTIFSAVSLTIAIAMVVMWMRSYYVLDLVGRRVQTGPLENDSQPIGLVPGNVYAIGSGGGGITLARYADKQIVFKKFPVSDIFSYQDSLVGAHRDVDPYDGRWRSYRHADIILNVLFRDFRAEEMRRTKWWFKFGNKYPSIFVPYWFLVALNMLPAAIWTKRWIRKRRRIKRGLCVICGYDLRESRERCPECGTPMRVERSIHSTPRPDTPFE